MLRWVFQVLERTAIKRSRVTIVICPHLEETARKVVPERARRAHRKRAGLGRHPGRRSGKAIRDIARHRRDGADGALHRHIRGVSGAGSAVCGGQRLVHRERPDVRFVLAGGKPDQVARAKAQAAAIGADGLIFTGEQPSDAIPAIWTPPTCWCRRAAPARTRR